MKDVSYKERLVKHCLQQQQLALKNARNAMDEAQEEANAYGQPKDRYDGFRNQQLRKRDLFGKQLEQALHNIDMINKITLDKPLDHVDFGSVVITDSTTFLIAIGLGFISFEGEEVAVISMLVPLFHEMKNKRVGDSFSFKDQTYTILGII